MVQQVWLIHIQDCGLAQQRKIQASIGLNDKSNKEKRFSNPNQSAFHA